MICLRDLPAHLRRRSQHGLCQVPRWGELGGGARRLLLQEPLAPNERILTQLSDLEGVAASLPECFAAPAMARTLVEQLYARGPEAMAHAGITSATIWCPQESSAVGRLMAAYLRHATLVPEPVTLRMIVLLDAPAGCSDAVSLADLWPHPLLNAIHKPQWSSLVRSVRFTDRPLEVVLGGGATPLQGLRTLLLVTLAPTAAPTIPTVISSADVLLRLDSSFGISMDCLFEDVPHVRRLVHEQLRHLRVRWADPCRSLGTSPAARRVLLRAFFPAATVTALDVRAMIHQLRSLNLPTSTLISGDDIFGDGAAPLLEVASPLAAPMMSSLCDEMAFVGPKRLTVRTFASPEAWGEKLEQAFAEDPDCCALRLRWRPSRLGGRVIAQPAATRRQLDACAREAARVAVPPGAAAPRQVQVQTSAPVRYDGAAVVHGLLAHLASQGLSFSPAAELAPLQAGQWAALKDQLGDSVDGRLRLAVGSEAQARQVVELLHEKAIVIGSDVITVTASEDGLLQSASKNCRRGRRRGAAPPTTTPA